MDTPPFLMIGPVPARIDGERGHVWLMLAPVQVRPLTDNDEG